MGVYYIIKFYVNIIKGMKFNRDCTRGIGNLNPFKGHLIAPRFECQIIGLCVLSGQLYYTYHFQLDETWIPNLILNYLINLHIN